jgi:hypothetical protein
MDEVLTRKIKAFQTATLFSVFFALAGFSYNVWRMEVSEHNSNVRTACFEILLELAALEQLVYSAHYDQDPIEGNPRKGWVKVGLINDLSLLTEPAVVLSSAQLKRIWANHWERLSESSESANKLVDSIETVRKDVKTAIQALK